MRIKIIAKILTLSLMLICSCQSHSSQLILLSPDGSNEIKFYLSNQGELNYLVKHNEITVIDSSSLSFRLSNDVWIKDGFEITDYSIIEHNENWEMLWGEQRIVNNHYNELMAHLTSSDNKELKIYFRAYEDGVAFRYEFLKISNSDSIIILDENTEFNLTGNHTCWWIPGDWDIYEHLYNTTKFTEIDAIEKSKHVNLAQSYIPFNAVNTPITMKTSDGIYLAFHEANLTDYPGTTLLIDKEKLSMKTELVGSDRYGWKAKIPVPFKTPWRMILIADKAKDLVDSRTILNLNEPNRLGNISWFKPMKYVGIWWEMHVGISSWDISSGKHGATTGNAKRYIDFASRNGIEGLLVEGWNTGWEHWIGFEDREGVFDFVTPYPDYDLNKVVNYANRKGVKLIMHHETSAAPRTYEQQLDTAYSLMKKLNIHAVKTGYVGKIIPKGEYHHGQWMVKHYRKVLKTAANYQIAVNAHEPIKATGIRRTYPNAIAREGLRGQEFNAWSVDGGNPPEHISIIAFTRMLAGPIDFTPGVFDILIKPKPNNRVNTTLAHQLALYVVIYSPIQMACDLPENYEGHPAFQFIRDVGVDWDTSLTLDGEIGDYIVIARQEKETGNWFVGGVTDENEREYLLDLSFLEEDVNYNATIYKDGENADWKTNPLSYDIQKMTANYKTTLKLKMAPGGGFAVSLIKK